MTTDSSVDSPRPLESTRRATERRIAPRLARPITQPSVNAGPFTRPGAVTSMSTTATIGNGLMAIPTAVGRTWPIASPIFSSRPPATLERGRHPRIAT
jgi:hypothetical protein